MAVRLQMKLGVVAVRGGRLDEAVRLFREAVEAEPRNPEALLSLAGALAKGGRAMEAVPYFERALEAGSPSTLALNGLGFARLEAGDPAGALAALSASLRLDPRQASVARTVAELAGGPGPR